MKSCSKAVLGLVLGYGKSPCFWACALLVSVDVGCGSSGFAVFNMAIMLE